MFRPIPTSHPRTKPQGGERQDDGDDYNPRAHISADGFFCPQEEKIVDDDPLVATLLTEYFHPSSMLKRTKCNHCVSQEFCHNNRTHPPSPGGGTTNMGLKSSLSTTNSSKILLRDVNMIEVTEFVSQSSLLSSSRGSFSFLRKKIPYKSRMELRQLRTASLCDLYELDDNYQDNTPSSSRTDSELGSSPIMVRKNDGWRTRLSVSTSEGSTFPSVKRGPHARRNFNRTTSSRWSTTDKENAGHSYKSLTIVDDACGDGKQSSSNNNVETRRSRFQTVRSVNNQRK
jgi:hypothetical protein